MNTLATFSFSVFALTCLRAESCNQALNIGQPVSAQSERIGLYCIKIVQVSPTHSFECRRFSGTIESKDVVDFNDNLFSVYDKRSTSDLTSCWLYTVDPTKAYDPVKSCTDFPEYEPKQATYE